jgi:hypothetical protein
MDQQYMVLDQALKKAAEENEKLAQFFQPGGGFS